MNSIIKPITLILRGYDAPSIHTVALEADKYRCFNLEITTNTESVFSSIREIRELNLHNVRVGAGTVLNMEMLVRAYDAGAEFALSPTMMSEEMLRFCREKDIISVPGAFSPSEIKQMLDYGADIVKVFPAARVGPKYISDVMAPLGHIPLMVVGGVNKDNLPEYFAAGAEYAGIGSGICNRAELQSGNTEALQRNLKKLTDLMGDKAYD
jgi:2-dehydro-3-deoxyphosphogluconate aldolase/(4S)-4-hydroxy-2-oxoglutarate aldolase